MIQRALNALKEAGHEALLVNDNVNVQWLTGFTGSFGAVLLSQNDPVFVTDSRYTVQAKEQVKGLPVVSFGSPKTMNDVLSELMAERSLKQVGFEKSISYQAWETYQEKIPGVEWVPVGPVLAGLRKIKSADEIARIKKACELADACLRHVERMIQPGVAELDISIEIEFFFRRQGAKCGFNPIVVGGPNSARPHGTPGERPLERGDFVTLDLGCTLDGYNSDITRTFVVAEASDQHREIYNQVLRANVECCAMLVAGANGRDVDGHARAILDEKDLAQYFGHSLGHGLGRDVHDPGRLHVSADEPILEGQVWTVEPGVYIEGFGGVRVEDDVVVTANGPEILNAYPKELMILGG